MVTVGILTEEAIWIHKEKCFANEQILVKRVRNK